MSSTENENIDFEVYELQPSEIDIQELLDYSGLSGMEIVEVICMKNQITIIPARVKEVNNEKTIA